MAGSLKEVRIALLTRLDSSDTVRDRRPSHLPLILASPLELIGLSLTRQVLTASTDVFFVCWAVEMA
jgi:hypothetical protein